MIDMATGASLLQAGSSILGGIMGSNAGGRAAQAQIDAANIAAGNQAWATEQAQRAFAPYSKTGEVANKRLSVLLGLDRGGTAGGGKDYLNAPMSLEQFMAQYDQPQNRSWFGHEQSNIRRGYDQYLAGLPTADAAPDAEYGSLTRSFTNDDLNADPVYQSGLEFGLDQGTRGINERAIANGGYDSGATLKALTRFGNDYGSTKAGESYNRFTGRQNQKYNMLSGQQAMGINAASGSSNAAMAGTAAQNNLITDAANARAAGIVGGANSMAQGFGGIGTAIQGYQNNHILNRLLNRGGGGGGYNMADVSGMFLGI